jgi:hypothetical protein
MHHISHIDDPQVIDKILGHLGLPTQMPRRAPARAPPQAELDFADVDEPELDDVPVFIVDWPQPSHLFGSRGEPSRVCLRRRPILFGEIRRHLQRRLQHLSSE